MPPAPSAEPSQPLPSRSTLIILIALWLLFYASFTLFTPPLLDDADSVHAEVAREMLVRHDWITLYANGIRYLEKAPLLYWSMALSMKLFGVSAPAARLPLALTVLGLTLALAAFARRAFCSPRTGLYAGLITLSSFGIFIFTRITIPDADVCLWLTLGLLCFWLAEQQPRPGLLFPCLFAGCCALNVLTKGLIGIVFPIAIVAVYLVLTRGLRASLARLGRLHPLASVAVFLIIAAPWHILIGLANATQGTPGSLSFQHGHWFVPLPTDGNVHGWTWFYFVNEHLLRYLNLRVPRDYDTVPLALFWGLLLIWLMPWSAFIFHAIAAAIPVRNAAWRARLRTHTLSARQQTGLLLAVWAALPMLFFSFSTRQEYYVLPAIPPLILLIAAWLADTSIWNNPAEAALPASIEAELPATAEAELPATIVISSETLSSRPKRRDPQLFPEPTPAAHTTAAPTPAAPTSAAPTPRAITTEPSLQLTAIHKTRIAQARIATILLLFGTTAAAACLFFVLHAKAPSPNTDLASLLQQNPGDYALSFGHFLDLNAQAMEAFRTPLLLTAIALFGSSLANLLLRRRHRPHAATLSLAAGAFLFLLAAHLGLQTFAPVLSSQQLAVAIAPQLRPQDLIVLHGEYEAGSSLGFYLKRSDLHILEGRSSNLWYGSFFPDAPHIFETRESVAQRWQGTQRIFLWEDPGDHDRPPLSLSPAYQIASSGGKQILSNQPNR